MHFLFRPYGELGTQARTLLSTACHASGEPMSLTLEGGAVVEQSHPRSVFCFTRPLRFWYTDLVDT